MRVENDEVPVGSVDNKSEQRAQEASISFGNFWRFLQNRSDLSDFRVFLATQVKTMEVFDNYNKLNPKLANLLK